MMEGLRKIDYIIVTKNDEKTIEATIDSIRNQSNVNRIIVVASSDSRVAAKQQLYYLQQDGEINVLRYESTGLAFARYLGIMIVETRWFAFVDADIVLPPNWSGHMMNFADDARRQHIGAFMGQAYRNDVHREYLEQNHITHTIKERMFTHNTVISTDVVSDWLPDFDISAYEDYDLTQHIIAKDKVCMSVPLFVFHDNQHSVFWGGCVEWCWLKESWCNQLQVANTKTVYKNDSGWREEDMEDEEQVVRRICNSSGIGDGIGIPEMEEVPCK